MSADSLAFLCSRCGGRYDDLDSLLGHACPYLAARARGFPPEQAAIEAHMQAPASAEAPRESRPVIEQAVEIPPAAEAIQPMPIPAPYGRPRRQPAAPEIPPVAPARKGRKAYSKRRPTADVAADKAARRAAIAERNEARHRAREAKAAERQARAAERQAANQDEAPPERLPDSGTLPIHGPAPTDNPSHPVRSNVIAPRWRRISTEPVAPTRYCACGMALPLRPRERCENCGRPVHPMPDKSPHAA